MAHITFATNKSATLGTVAHIDRRKTEQHKNKKVSDKEFLSTETRNAIWNENQLFYNILFKPHELSVCNVVGSTDNGLKDLIEIQKNWKKYINFVFSLPEFQQFQRDATKNKRFVRNEWKVKHEQVLKIIDNICHTHIDFGTRPIKIIIVSQQLAAGCTFKELRKIQWSGKARHHFPNYDVVYIMHELFHLIFPFSNVAHAIQELICDNELRKRLNGNDCYELKYVHNGEEKCVKTVGHEWLDKIREKLIPHWHEYLKNDSETIWSFVDRMNEKMAVNDAPNKTTQQPKYKAHLSEPWFTLISLGLKTVEGRKNKGMFKEMQVGDVIEWFNDDFNHRSILTKITKKNEYATFIEYLEIEGINKCLPGMPSLEHGLSVYFKYFTKEEETEFGVTAINFELIS